MNRFRVEVLKAVRHPDGREYVPTGQAEEVLAHDEWEAGRKFFQALGIVSLPTPAFALRVRRIRES